MAGRRKAPEAPEALPIPSNSLVASAVRYGGQAARIYRPSQGWQKEAYRHYAICGEARFAANYYGNAMSKVTLHTAKKKPGGGYERTDTGPAAEHLAALFNGKDGQEQMLSAIGTHLTIAGECYLVGRTVKVVRETEVGVVEVGDEVWEIVSVTEMKVTGNKWVIEYGDDKYNVPLTDDDVVIRIWRPHPERRIEADSPFRSLLPVLDEIEWLTKHIFAQCASRLAGAGILFMPQGASFPQPPSVDGKQIETLNEADLFMLTLAEAMLKSIADPSLPSALVPITVTLPDDLVDKAHLMHFWSDLDEKALEMRTAAIHRFAIGMDLPPEKIEGMSGSEGTGGGNSNGVSHWGAWQIDEETIKLHIEPACELVVNSLTVAYVRPLSESDEVVRYDTANLRLRPDRSKESMELWDRGALKTEVMLRENGFSPEDYPEEPEQRQWFLRKIASGSATPEQVGAALAALGIDLPVAATPEPDPARESRPPPSLEEHPGRELPEAAAVILAACEPLVFRALERAGNRLRTAGAKPDGIPSYETHLFVEVKDVDYVLDDAWTCATQTLQGIADVEATIKVLDSYARTLLSTQTPHSRNLLAKWLEGVAA
jgi:hypothetical protein